jgi:hypothetical protein
MCREFSSLYFKAMKRRNWRYPFHKASADKDVAKSHCRTASDLTDVNQQPSQPAGTSRAHETSNQPSEHRIGPKPNKAASKCEEHHDRAHVDATTATAASNLAKKDYWQLALDELKTDKDFPEKVLAAVQQVATQGGSNLSEQLLIATERSRKALLERQWKIEIGNKEIVIREQLEKILKAVQLFKDLGSAAARIDPVHAGLPWAGLCLLMEVCSLQLCIPMQYN